MGSIWKNLHQIAVVVFFISFYSDGIADRLMAGTTISLDIDYEQVVAAIKQIGEEGVRWDDVTVLCILEKKMRTLGKIFPGVLIFD